MRADHYMRSTVSNNMLGSGSQSGNYPNTLVLELLHCNALHCREQVCMVGNYAARQITDNCAGLPIVAMSDTCSVNSRAGKKVLIAGRA